MKYKRNTVSVIIPVYNTGIYLEKCLNSVIESDYKDIDIILINDGSKDDVTLEILDKYKNYPKIRYFNNENMGISLSRNFGLDRVDGEYLMFVDSDDYIEKDMISKMVNRIIKDKTDMVQASFYVEYEHYKLRRVRPKNDVLSKDEMLKALMKNMGVNNYLWGKLYRSEIFEDIRFNKDYKGFEDVEIMPKIFMKLNSASLMKNRFYHYIQRRGSYTNHMNIKIASDMYDSFRKQEEYINNHRSNLSVSNVENYYRSEMMMLYIMMVDKLSDEELREFKYPQYDDENVWLIFKMARGIMKFLVKLKYGRKVVI